MLIKRLCCIILLVFNSLYAGAIREFINFSISDFKFQKIDGYDYIDFSYGINISEPGSPSLPEKDLYFLIPPSAEIVEVKIISKKEDTLAMEYNIYPGQKCYPLSYPESFKFTSPNKKIYLSSDPYPKDYYILYSSGLKSGFRIQGIGIYPLRYIPAKKKLILIKHMEIEVVYQEGKHEVISLTENQLKKVRPHIESIVTNPEDILRFSPPLKHISRQDEINYIIITSEQFSSYFTRIRDWRTQEGYKAQIFTTTWIYNNYSGYDDQEKIRNFIKDYFQTHGLIFVLLGGDAEIVPVRKAYIEGMNDPWVATDLYYADLDGTWDADGDHIYGEMWVDGVDVYADVFVGRLPARGVSHIQYFTDKIFTYEKNPALDYLNRILLPSVMLYYNTGWHGKEVNNAIADSLDSTWNVIKLEDPSRYAVRDSFSNGFNLLHSAVHGTVYGWFYESGQPVFYITDVPDLMNGQKYTIVNSIACHWAGFDEVPTSLAESLLTIYPNGAVAIVGNTREGFLHIPGFGPSELLSIKFYSNFAKKKDFRIGELHFSVKDFYRDYILNYRSWAFCGYELSLLGDPAMRIWNLAPESLMVNHPAQIHIGEQQEINVIVMNYSVPVESALVCLYKPNEVYEKGYTNALGEISLSVFPNTEGPMYITVTKSGYLPYEDTIQVVQPLGVYIVRGYSIVSDSMGNGSGIINPGETIDYLVYAKNIGLIDGNGIYGLFYSTDSSVTLLQDSSWYGDIPSGDSSLSLPAYRFHVSDTSSNNKTISFVIVFHDINDSTWTSNFSLKVYKPIIQKQGEYITNDTNGNGILEPDETGDLIISIKNIGGDATQGVTGILKSFSSYITVLDTFSNFGPIPVNDSATNLSDPFTLYASPSTPGAYQAQLKLITTTEYDVDTFDITITIGKKHYYVWDPDPNKSSGYIIDSLLNELGYIGDYDSVLDNFDTSRYMSLFVCVGVTPNKYEILRNSPEAQIIENFAQNQNGRVYLEGGDVWYYDPLHGGHDFGSLFGINAIADGSDDLGPVEGQTGTFTQGMYFNYSGENNWIDHIQAQASGAFDIFYDTDNAYYCGVANDAQTYRTVGMSFELSGLDDGTGPSTKKALIDSIMHFFGIYTISVQEKDGVSLNTPRVTRLLGAVPNPFFRNTQIVFDLASKEKVNLIIYDATGRTVQKLIKDEFLNPGNYRIKWSVNEFAQGVYFIKLKTETYRGITKGIILK